MQPRRPPSTLGGMPHPTNDARRLMHGDVNVDTRWVLRVYAAVTIVVGISMTTTGIRGIDGVPLAHESLIWMIGMAVVAAGCAASGLALNDDPVSRRRALVRFAIGHLLLGLIVWMQWAVYWGKQGLPLPAALAPLAAGIILLTTAMSAWLREPDGAESGTTRRIRSAYDEHIRQIARREERARLARDLHDAVKQQLFVIQTAAATAQARFDADAPGARGALADVRTAARDATTEMEALLDELQAAPMENTGLVEALKKQCEALAMRTGAAVNFQPDALPTPGAIPPGAHEAMYRVAQEALANVARHARADRVDVSLHTTATEVELRVTDNGSGFDTSTRRRGMGIANMDTRAAEIGGRVLIVAGSTGTEVVLSVPVANAAARVAWRTATILGLALLNLGVFCALMGERPPLLLLLLLPFGAWGTSVLIEACRKRSNCL